jgi:hypothetical protein
MFFRVPDYTSKCTTITISPFFHRKFTYNINAFIRVISLKWLPKHRKIYSLNKQVSISFTTTQNDVRIFITTQHDVTISRLFKRYKINCIVFLAASPFLLISYVLIILVVLLMIRRSYLQLSNIINMAQKVNIFKVAVLLLKAKDQKLWRSGERVHVIRRKH